jgi:predicted O-methyltransferase YrrM
MSQQLWSAVDEYVEDQLLGRDPALEQALSSAEQAGLPSIAVTPAQGKLLHLLARTIGARSILELGTLGGYISIWLARALPPEGRLVTLELSERYAEVARASIERAGVAALVDVRVGPALESLQLLRSSGEGPFDLVFIDADKQSTPEYFTQALELVHQGSLIVVDNVVRDGGLIDAQSVDRGVQGMRRFHELLTGESRVSATTIQTVGAKGYDGFTLALVE